MALFSSWFVSKSAGTAIEYSLLAAGIALALIAVLFAMGDSLVIVMDAATTALKDAADNASSS